MITNTSLTIYNSKFDASSNTHVWTKTIIEKANWYESLGSSRDSGGTDLNKTIKVRIPDNGSNGDGYVDESQYESMNDVSGVWTLKNDDFLVKGVCDLVISSPKDLFASGVHTCRINSWSDNRRGKSPHWRVGGI